MARPKAVSYVGFYVRQIGKASGPEICAYFGMVRVLFPREVRGAIEELFGIHFGTVRLVLEKR